MDNSRGSANPFLEGFLYELEKDAGIRQKLMREIQADVLKSLDSLPMPSWGRKPGGPGSGQRSLG